MQRDLSRYAPVVLRLAMAGVYIWFGVSQITNARMWLRLVPAWATQPLGIEASTVVAMNGWFEIVAAILLILGVAVRPVALLLFAHLVVISVTLLQAGSTAIGVRDLGLSFATLASALFGTDSFCYDPFARRKALKNSA